MFQGERLLSMLETYPHRTNCTVSAITKKRFCETREVVGATAILSMPISRRSRSNVESMPRATDRCCSALLPRAVNKNFVGKSGAFLHCNGQFRAQPLTPAPY